MRTILKNARLAYSFLVALLLPMAAEAATLSIEPFTINAGEEKTMTIDLNNSDMEVTMVQFDLRLPTGLTMVENSYDIAGRTNWRNHNLNCNSFDGVTRFLLTSQNNDVLTGTSGAIISFKLKASSSFSGGTIQLENILLTSPSMQESKPADVTYTISAPAPTPKLILSASPSGGQVSAGTTVTLTAKADGSTVSGCDIYFTTDGSAPSRNNGTKYSSGITINSACTLKAIAYKSGYEDSEVLTATYTIKEEPKPKLVLSASPSGGQVSAGTTVTLTAKANGSTVSGCDIYYTTNGTTPSRSNGTKYTYGITINSACTLKAIAYKSGYEDSDVLTATYTIQYPDIVINAANFPDENFRNYLLSQSYGEDGVITSNEINSITEISVASKSIASLNGIAFFTSLTKLRCNNNQLTSLDVSMNSELIELACYSNQLKTIDVSNNTKLKRLYCSLTNLSSLDVTKLFELEELVCDANYLTTLDVSKNKKLTSLSCGWNNKLSSLNLSNNTQLKELFCSCCKLTELDLLYNQKLEEIFCDNNSLTKFYNYSKALNELNCSGNPLITLDCSYGKLKSLDISNNTELELLRCNNNQLESLDVSKNTKLTELNCSGNQLTSLDVSKNTKLTELNCSGNQLTSLDVSKNTELTRLDCSLNQLITLDTSKNLALSRLHCYDNMILGKYMDSMINSLPVNTNKEQTHYIVLIDLHPDSKEGNICTKRQVANLKEKGWTAQCCDSHYRIVDYEGSDENTSVTFSSTGYATFFSYKAAYNLPNGLSAQVVTGANNNKLTYKTIADGSVSGVVPKGTAVMLVSNNKQAGTYTLTASESTATYTGTNLLRGSDEATTTTGDGLHYKLSYGPSGTGWKDVFGWYWGAQNGAPFQIEGHKAWLVVPRGNGTRAEGFSVEGEALGIEIFDDSTISPSDDCYDLQGRRVSLPTTKGIYIRNGKKIVNR